MESSLQARLMPYDVALIIGGWINKVVVPQWQFSLTAAHKNPQQLKESKSIIRQYLFFVITSKKQIPQFIPIWLRVSAK